MNDGSIGFPVGAVGRRISSKRVAFASATYTVSDNAAQAVRDDGGSSALTLTLLLPYATLALVRFCGRYARGSGRSTAYIYDNGVGVWPKVPLPTGGGSVRWYGRPVNENNLHQMQFEAPLFLPAGSHAITVRHEASLTVTNITWGDRVIMAHLLEPLLS